MLISCLCFHSGGEEWYLLIYLTRVNVAVCENVFIRNVHEGHYLRACVYTSRFVRRPLWMDEGFPIHPTGVNSSLVFAIQLTGYQFENPIPWNRHELLPLQSIWHAGSQFVWDLENIADLGFEGGFKMLSIQLNSIEWTQIVSPVVNSSYRKPICSRLWTYSAPGQSKVG